MFTVTFRDAAIEIAYSYEALKGHAGDVGGSKSGVVSGASDLESLEKAVGKVNGALRYHPQGVTPLNEGRSERLTGKMKEDEKKNLIRSKDMKLGYGSKMRQNE